MVNKCGNLNIGQFSYSAIETGLHNMTKLVLWLISWGWTTERVIQKLLGVKNRPCARFVKRRVLSKIKPPKGFSSGYVLRKEYFQAGIEFNRFYSSNHGYGEVRLTSIPFKSLGCHNEIAQLALLEYLNEFENLVYFTESEVRSRLRGERDIAIPDFETFFHTGRFKVWRGFEMAQESECQTFKVWHEVELSQKYEFQLFFKLQGLDSARKSKLFTCLLWWSDKKIRAKLMKALQRERIPYVVRQPNGRFTLDLEQEGWSPKKLFAMSEFRGLPRIPS